MTATLALLIVIFILVFFLVLFTLAYLYANGKVFFKKLFNLSLSSKEKISSYERDLYLKDLADTLFFLSYKKIGALIVNEQRNSLALYSEKGYKMDGLFNKAFTIAIFANKNAPFHDGALLVSGNRIVAISCYVPVSESNIDNKYGARHRAAMGITESTDAIAIIVSETTGMVSYAKKGELIQIGKTKKEIENAIKVLF